MAKKSEVPPVLILSGSEDLLRLRFLKEIRSTKKAEGWTVEDVDGGNKAALRDALEGDLFVQKNTLAVVYKPNKADLDLLKRHAETKAPLTTLLLHIEGEPDGRTKFGKFVKEMSAFHKAFPKPKEWEAPKVAAAFFADELKMHGKTIDPNLAGALVQRVGADLGMLAFEALKVAALADGEQVEAVHVKGAMAQIAEAAIGPVLDALELRDRRKLSKALDRLNATSKYDPTMRVCRFLGSAVQRWLMAVYMDNLPPKVAAQELGLNPWFFEKKILPPAKRWGKAGAVQLAHGIAASERAVLNGAQRPWVVLTARLMDAC